MNVQRGVFTPLVFATNGMCGPETEVFLKSLAALIVDKNKDIFWPEGLRIGMLNCKGNVQFNLRSYNHYSGLKSSSIFPHVSLLFHELSMCSQVE